MKNQYEQDLKIDPDDLERCWIEQPLLYMQYSEQWADACKERDHLKEQLDVTKSEIITDVKNNPEKYDLEKSPTVQVIDAIVLKQKEYKAASEKFNDAVHNARVLDTARTAFEHRKYALQSLTQLWLSNYYSNPSIPADARERPAEARRQQMRESAKKGRPLGKKKLVKRG